MDEGSFRSIARDAGVLSILCPHCGRHHNGIVIVRRLFKLIDEAVMAGRRVSVAGFGVFFRHKREGRMFGFGGFVPDAFVMRFKQAPASRKRFKLHKEEVPGG